MASAFSIPGKPSLTRRVFAGEIVGFLAGLIIVLFLPTSEPELGLAYKAGFVFWHVIEGAVIGFTGFYTVHPVARIAMPWWLRGGGIGGFSVLVIYWLNVPAAIAIVGHFFNLWTAVPVAVIALIAGVTFGLVTEFICTRFGGEGHGTGHEPETV